MTELMPLEAEQLVAAHFVKDDENNQQTGEEVLLPSTPPSWKLPNGDTTPALKPGRRPVPRLRNSNHRSVSRAQALGSHTAVAGIGRIIAGFQVDETEKSHPQIVVKIEAGCEDRVDSDRPGVRVAGFAPLQPRIVPGEVGVSQDWSEPQNTAGV